MVDNLPIGKPIHWPDVAEKVERAPLACARQWHEVRHKRLRFSEFSPAEDSFIWKTVRETGEKARYVFEGLQKTLKRNAMQIRDHFYGYLMQSEHNVDMYPENPVKAAKWRKKRNSW